MSGLKKEIVLAALLAVILAVLLFALIMMFQRIGTL